MFDRHKLLRRVGVVLLLFVLFLLAACSRGSGNSAAASASTAGNATTAQTGAGAGANGQFGQFGGAPFESAYLTNTYESALPTTMQLMLGTLSLVAIFQHECAQHQLHGGGHTHAGRWRPGCLYGRSGQIAADVASLTERHDYKRRRAHRSL